MNFWNWLKSIFSSHPPRSGEGATVTPIVPPAPPATPAPRPQDPNEAKWNAPWVFPNLDLLGRYETDHDLNARYVPEWSREGLSGYKTLSGNDYAWCSLCVNADMRKVGVIGTNNAGASSWTNWGKKSPFWFGSILDIRHPSGGRHVNRFLYWIDEKNRIAATLDGNKGNRFCVAVTDLKSDIPVTGPRWPGTLPDGHLLTKAQVLAAYPNLKVTGDAGGSTR